MRKGEKLMLATSIFSFFLNVVKKYHGFCKEGQRSVTAYTGFVV